MDVHDTQHMRITKIEMEDLTTILKTNKTPNANAKLPHTNRETKTKDDNRMKNLRSIKAWKIKKTQRVLKTSKSDPQKLVEMPCIFNVRTKVDKFFAKKYNMPHEKLPFE